jgi:hypothetical protein
MALALDGNVLYAGGYFTHAGVEPRAGLAALDATTGDVTSWNPSTNATITALGAGGGLVHIGGFFTDMGGQPRANFATVRASNGLAVDWNPNVEGDYRSLPDGSGSFSGAVGAIFVSGNSLTIGGEFTSVGGWPSVGVAQFTVDLATPTLISLAGASAEVGRVAIEWYSNGTVDRAVVDRRTNTSDWSRVGTVTADGRGMIGYLDTNVIAGARYGYRLGVVTGGVETWLGEVWVDVPRAATFALAGARPNPAIAGLNVAFSLPDAAPARIELFDLLGRRVLRRDVGGLGLGNHLVDLATGRKPEPGVYLLRLTRGSQSASRQVIVAP